MTSPDRRSLLAGCRPAWASGHADRAWDLLRRAEAATDRADAVQRIETDAVRAGLLLLAERPDEARDVGRACLDAATALGEPERDRVATAVADVRVTLASLHVEHGDVTGGPEEAALRTLTEVALDPRLVGSEPAARAVSNRLLLRLALLSDALDTTHGQVEAWMAVSEALAVSRDWDEAARARQSVHRQAIDLAFATGQWQRGWDLTRRQLEVGCERNERVSVLAKAALLAWHRRMLPEARDLGAQARALSVAVDLPWVRTYAYLGGVIHAAAGGGPLDAALRAYTRCTDAAGHATRPGRAWQAALVALDAGHPLAEVEAFVAGVLPEGSEHPAFAGWARVLLADLRGDGSGGAVPTDPDLALGLDGEVRTRADRARLQLAFARAHRRTGHDTDAVAALARARWLLRDWPGALLDAVEAEAAAATPGVRATPAQARVLDLLAEGHTNAAIASALGLSDRTVAVHVTALLTANDAATRTELAARHLRHRLLDPITPG